MTDTATDGEDRELLKRVLQSMSSQVSGWQSATDFVPDTFLPNVDEPQQPTLDPMDPATEEQTRAVHKAAGGGRYAWGGYENGRIPTKALKAIGQGSHRLEAQAADAWMAMREAAAKEGVTLKLTDSYRTYDQQVAVRASKGHKVATATPGTSVHGWGRAVDANVNEASTLRWLRANGPKYGWVNPEWAQAAGKNHEPWHWEFQG